MTKRCQPLHCICGCTIAMRVVVSTFCALGIIVGYGQRQCLNVAITRMVPPSAKNHSNECPRTNTSLYGENIKGGHFEWDQTVQGYILSSFFIGYLLGQMPAGIAGDLISGTYTYLAGIGISTLITILFPVLIRYLPWHVVCGGRILMGFGQGATYPCTGVLLAHWVPPYERSTLGAFSFASNSLGTVFGNLFTGMWMTYTRYWPSAFYFWGAVGIIWSFGVLVWVRDKPADHPYVTQAEIEFLKGEMINCVKWKVPWKRIFCDFGIWSLIVGQVGHDFTIYFIVTSMPKYFSDVLYMSVRSIALSTSLPFIGLWLVSVASGKICDYGIKQRNWSVLRCRRVLTYIGFLFPNAALVLMIYVNCNIPVAVTCFTFACISKGPHFAGLRVNHMDLTINFSGTIVSIVNTVGCISGILSPLIISQVAPNNRISEWKKVIWIIFGAAGVCTTFYVFTSRASRAEWDVPQDELEEYKANKQKEEEETKRKKELKEAQKLEKKRQRQEAKEATTSKA